jgi:hypothetical protein
MTKGGIGMNGSKSDRNGNLSEPRKPYVKPSFSYERVFETIALTCVHAAGHNALCNSTASS